MAQLTQLTLQHIRNLSEAQLTLNPRLNLFYGDNASGKTSLLESLYYLAHGRSFRTSQADKIIQHEQDHLLIQATLAEQTLGAGDISIGIQTTRGGGHQIKCNGQKKQSLSALAAHLPVQYLGTESQRLLSDGPKLRRKALNWGLFHVEPRFHTLWKAFNQSLKQRNAALKSRYQDSSASIWDESLSELGESINTLARLYIEALAPRFQSIATELLGDAAPTLTYDKGWQGNYLNALQSSYKKDTLLGYTHCGPHRCDLTLTHKGLAAQDILSQGQQKLAVYALYLAQGEHLSQHVQQPVVYLIDDLASELDYTHRQNICNILARLPSQSFITSIHLGDLPANLLAQAPHVFHVKHNTITPIPAETSV
jgi:DNA replication and repair protein RecF